MSGFYPGLQSNFSLAQLTLYIFALFVIDF
jgi:hypothetical protein